jgi:hypothetical protein
MTLGPFGPLSQQHADAEVKRVSERAQLHGQDRTFGHDLFNAVFLLRRLVRRVRRRVRRVVSR